jgi:DNA-binding response OmpR family regulator
MEAATKKLLIIEDEQAILYSLTQKFRLINGIQTISAPDGEEGLRMALKEQPDLILLDIILPKMDGVEMLKKLRQEEKGKNIKVIVLSNLSNEEKEKEAAKLGVKDYIIKADWKMEDVVKVVKKNLNLI